MASPRVVNIEDLRRLAKGRLPKPVFDYMDGGAENEFTLRENCRAFESVIFRPRTAVSVPECETSTEILGAKLSFPMILAPVGYSRMMHARGEVAVASAAGKAGIAFCLSTISGHTLENVRAATPGPMWYQLYLVGGRGAAEAGLERARKAGYSALAVTVDTPVPGMRERDVRSGTAALVSGSIFARLPYITDVLKCPGWLTSFLMDGGLHRLPNIVPPGEEPLKLINVASALVGSVVTWEDFKWIRELWPGPILVKGILTGDDARRSIDAGAAAVILSNHGGRQLDGVSATLRALPEVVRAANGQIEVLMDGGIRRGGDIVKALCLGARAVLVGRAYAYGLGAAGEAGVSRAVEILRADFERTMKLLGCRSIRDLDRSYVDIPSNWPA